MIDSATPAGDQRRQRPTVRGVAGASATQLIDSRPVLLVALNVGLGIFMYLYSGSGFLSTENLSSVALDASETGILTIGMAVLLIGGLVDLSIGGMLALTGIIGALVANQAGIPPELGWVAGMAAGGVCGLLNGVVVTGFRINPLIATLATAGIFRGVAQLFSGTGVTEIKPGFESLGQNEFLSLQYPVWVMLILAALFTFLTKRSRFFRYFYFIGGNERAARLSGIDTKRTQFLAFILMGVLAGLAGVLTASRLDAAVVSAGTGVELNVITAAVLGGAALTGGSGSVPGAVLAIFFISLVQNALIIAGVDVFWQQIVVGLVLILAVSTEYLQSRRT